MSQGLVLFAHGARDASWATPFESVAALLRARDAKRPVQLAFLEFMSPTLAEAGAQLAREGCTRVDVMPMFLGTGGHVRRDLPVMIEALRRAHPLVLFVLLAALGEQRTVQAAMAETIAALVNADALAVAGAGAGADTNANADTAAGNA
jgi:sirohydrochlorin cobaltochelatase